MLPEVLRMPSRKFSSLLLLQALLLSAAAASAQNIQTTRECAAISDPAGRLACYDAANAGGQNAGNPPAQENSHWPEFSSAVRGFAPAVRTTGSARQNGPVIAVVSSHEFMPDGRFVATLDNGEVWRQLSADAGRAQFRDRNRVVISRGFWHSYNLKLNGMNAVFKVERVK